MVMMSQADDDNDCHKRRNSFTVSFTKTVLDDGPYYCVVEKFVCMWTKCSFYDRTGYNWYRATI